MRRVDFEVNGLSVDALVAASNPGGFIFNLSLDIGKVIEPPVGDVMELSPLGSPCGGW